MFRPAGRPGRCSRRAPTIITPYPGRRRTTFHPAGRYAVSWVTPSVAQLKSGTYSVTLSSTLLQPSTTIALGNNSYRFGDLYAQGNIHLGEGSRTQISIGSSNSSLGFFGHAVAARQTVASTATVAQLITALKAYGLIA